LAGLPLARSITDHVVVMNQAALTAAAGES
jgi:hypothetical protein